MKESIVSEPLTDLASISLRVKEDAQRLEVRNSEMSHGQTIESKNLSNKRVALNNSP